MNNRNISKKILHWYDNNKRVLPWRKPKSKKQSEYFTLVSEIMLQQTQVKTVVPYFERFIYSIPNLNLLAKIKEKKLLKLWEGLGYYSRAKNLKKTAKILISKFNGRLPDKIEDLKRLPGIGDYTSRAILALEFNKKIIPLDGNVERLLKRVLFLKKQNEITKDNLMIKTNFFSSSIRQRDYVQALMEIGALICKPIEPLCISCPITNHCLSFKKKNFNLIKKNKKKKVKYFEANIYMNNNRIYLVRNKKFNFLKNFLIFPMNEIDKNKFNSSSNKKTNIKMSNMDMKILINKKFIKKSIQGTFLDSNKSNNHILPSFTKKLFRVAASQ